jgi:hypothetical protein
MNPDCRPPRIIEYEGYRYRLIGPVGARRGRPPKKPRINEQGEKEWFCPCCEDWWTEKHFSPGNLSNGLQSWCRTCKNEDRRYRRAAGGKSELGDWKERYG